MVDLCLNPPELISRGAFDASVNQLPEGTIPWVFGRGGFQTSESARIKPISIQYTNRSLVIQYASYSYMNNANCIVSSPRITVIMRGHCCEGIPKFSVHAFKADKQELVNYSTPPGGSDFSAFPLVADDCLRKYTSRDVSLRFPIHSFSLWLRTIMSYTIITGSPNNWFDALLSSNGTQPVTFCNDCKSLVNPTAVYSDLGWLSILDNYATVPTGVSPYSITTASELLKIATGADFITVLDTSNRSAKTFFKLEENCDKESPLIFESNGSIMQSCFIEPPDEEDEENNQEPDDSDERWAEVCPADSCTRQIRTYQAFTQNGFGTSPPVPGVYGWDETVPTIPGRLYGDTRIQSFDDGSHVFVTRARTVVSVWERESFYIMENDVCTLKQRKTVRNVYDAYRVVRYAAEGGSDSKAQRALWDSNSEQAIFNADAAFSRSVKRLQATKCGDPTDIDGSQPELPEPERQSSGPCDGNCYIKGNFTIDLSIGLRPFQKLLKVGLPEFSGNVPKDPLSPTVNYKPALNPKVSPFDLSKPGEDPVVNGINLKKQNFDLAKPPGQDEVKLDVFTLKIPFKVCLEDNEQSFGDFTVGIEDENIFISYKGRQFDLSLDSLFQAYNDAEFLIDFANPLPVGISDVEIICPDGGL